MIHLDVYYRGEKVFTKSSLNKEWLDNYKQALKMLVNPKELKFIWRL